LTLLAVVDLVVVLVVLEETQAALVGAVCAAVVEPC
jgi:hypothetical protein